MSGDKQDIWMKVAADPRLYATKALRLLQQKTLQAYQRSLHFLDRLLAPPAILLAEFLFDLRSGGGGRSPRCMLCCYHYTPGTTNLSTEIPAMQVTLQSYSAGRNINYTTYFWQNTPAQPFASVWFFIEALKYAPTHLVLSSYNSRHHFMPSLFAVRRLQARGIKIVFVWWDTCSKLIGMPLRALDHLATAHIIIDNPCLHFLDAAAAGAGAWKGKLLPLYYPLQYSAPVREKDIDVIFLGQIDSYRSVRKPYLDHLAENGLKVVTTDGLAGPVSERDYEDLLARSKIGINFSESVDSYQLKARVFELMRAGSLLVEQRNDQTAKYFVEGREFVAFSTKEELLEKLVYYTRNEEERQRIADAGHRKAAANHNGEKFWQMVFLACDSGDEAIHA